MDWTEKFCKHLQFAAEQVTKDYYVVGIVCKGSQNYGLATEDSDMDTLAIVIPRWHTLVKEKTPISTTHMLPNGEQIKVKDLRVFCREFPKSWSYWEVFTTNICYWDNRLTDIFYKPMKENLDKFAGADPASVMASILGSANRHYSFSKNDGKRAANVLWFAELGAKYTEGEPIETILQSERAEYLRDLKTGMVEVPIIDLNRELSQLEMHESMSKNIPRSEEALNMIADICAHTLEFAYRFLIKIKFEN